MNRCISIGESIESLLPIRFSRCVSSLTIRNVNIENNSIFAYVNTPNVSVAFIIDQFPYPWVFHCSDWRSQFALVQRSSQRLSVLFVFPYWCLQFLFIAYRCWTIGQFVSRFNGVPSHRISNRDGVAPTDAPKWVLARCWMLLGHRKLNYLRAAEVCRTEFKIAALWRS